MPAEEKNPLTLIYTDNIHVLQIYALNLTHTGGLQRSAHAPTAGGQGIYCLHMSAVGPRYRKGVHELFSHSKIVKLPQSPVIFLNVVLRLVKLQ